MLIDRSARTAALTACLAATAWASPSSAQQFIQGGGTFAARPTFQQAMDSDALFDTYATGSGDQPSRQAFLQNNPALLDPWFPHPEIHFSNAVIPMTATEAATYPTSAPGSNSGRLIQFPAGVMMLGLHVNLPGHSGPLALTTHQVCRIYTGSYTHWNTLDPSLPATPITVGYLTTNSSLTYILSRFLMTNCNPGEQPPNPVVTHMFSDMYGTVPMHFTAVTSNTAMAILVNGHPDTIGYNTVDIPSPALVSIDGFAPTPANATAAMSAFAPPGGTVITNPSSPGYGSGNNPGNPLSWGVSPPVTQPYSGYPLVHYVFTLASQCYQSATVRAAMKSMLNRVLTLPYADPLAPLPNATRAAVVSRFLGSGTLAIGDPTYCATVVGR